MKYSFTKSTILALMLLGLPLSGVILSGKPVRHYIEFPPLTHYVRHTPFNWYVFIGLTVFLMVVLLPFFKRAVRSLREDVDKSTETSRPFPWWGWIGLVAGAFFWILAWNRFTWFESFQRHTFTPLWISYIVVMNAMTYRKGGRCLMRDQSHLFLSLFPASSVFWWFFEYLNRFVQNWYYNGVEFFSPLEYVAFASLSFATVLPAVASTQQWLVTFNPFRSSFSNFMPIVTRYPVKIAYGTLILFGVGLGLISNYPNYLYPLLWLSPLFIITSLQTIYGEPNVFTGVKAGNWNHIVSWAFAALLCGFFWELWNVNSLSKWVYSVPYVQRFNCFEMPILGYSGYLPFGLECCVITTMLSGHRGRGN